MIRYGKLCWYFLVLVINIIWSYFKGLWFLVEGMKEIKENYIFFSFSQLQSLIKEENTFILCFSQLTFFFVVQKSLNALIFDYPIRGYSKGCVCVRGVKKNNFILFQ